MPLTREECLKRIEEVEPKLPPPIVFFRNEYTIPDHGVLDTLVDTEKFEPTGELMSHLFNPVHKTVFHVLWPATDEFILKGAQQLLTWMPGDPKPTE